MTSAASARSASERPDTRQLAMLWGVAAVVLLAMAPFGALLVSGLPACPFKAATGWPCAGCGTTRAALALAELRVVEALLRFPGATLAWVGFIGGGLAAGALALAGRGLPTIDLPSWSRWVILAAFLAHWAFLVATGV